MERVIIPLEQPIGNLDSATVVADTEYSRNIVLPRFETKGKAGQVLIIVTDRGIEIYYHVEEETPE